jgi:tetratricopeptide (TPR) repeat protein
MRKIAITILVCIFVNSIQSQDIITAYPQYDTAIEKYIRECDSVGLAAVYLNMLKDTEIHMSIENSDSLLLYSASVFEAIKDYTKAYQCYNLMSVLNFNKGNNHKALDYSLMAIDKARQNNKEIDEAIAESNMALIYTKIGDYERANEYNFKALRLFVNQKNDMHIARCKLGIGNVYYLLHDYEKANLFFIEADTVFVRLNDNKGHGICLTNMGSICKDMGEYEQALKYYSEAVSICDIDNDKDGNAYNYSNIGSVYIDLMDYRQAINYYNKSNDICFELNNNSLLSSNYLKLSKICFALEQFDTACDYCVHCLDLVEKTGEKNIESQALEQLSDVFLECGDYKKAYEYYRKASVINDSLLYVEKSARNALLEEKYNNERLEKGNLELRFANEIQAIKIHNQRQHIVGFAIISLTLSVLFVIILILYRKKNIAYKWIVKKNLEIIQTEQKIRSISNRVPEEKYNSIIVFLETEFIENKIYTDQELTLEKLAKLCKTNRTYLSKIINEEYKKNYTDLINGYRINEAIRLISDPVISQKYSIEAIANESGFTNISSFNTTFKKITGLTPSDFRKNISRI